MSDFHDIVVGKVIAQLSDGKVTVQIHSEHGEPQQDCWVLQPYAGNKFGMFMIPEVSSEVLVAWIKGMTEPVVLGCLWYGGDRPPTELQAGDPKLLQTKGGHQIRLVDREGAKKIEIVGSGGGNRIVIDTSRNSITIETGGKLRLRGSEIEIEAQGPLKLTGFTVSVTGQGPVNVEGKPINLN